MRKCKICQSTNIIKALDLGELPIANELTLSKELQQIFPLVLYVCMVCGIGQAPHAISPIRIFEDYRYLSSISSTFVAHAKEFAESMIRLLDFNTSDWVLEIASNDGYLLKNFLLNNIATLGIEPAKNVAKIANERGVPTLPMFFNAEVAKSLKQEYGIPRLIVANNVMAHVPDIEDFVCGLSTIMDDRTLLSVENPSIMNLLNDLQYDSIYHEHFSYLSATAIQQIASKFGLILKDIVSVKTHGGSNRYLISKNPSPVSSNVWAQIRSEQLSGLLSESHWSKFSSKVMSSITEFRKFVKSSKERGERIAGYGAAAKASTLLNSARLDSNSIEFISDKSPEKIGRYLPNTGIPIRDVSELFKSPVDKIIIFPWNLVDEICLDLHNKLPSFTELWVAVPQLRRVL